MSEIRTFGANRSIQILNMAILGFVFALKLFKTVFTLIPCLFPVSFIIEMIPEKVCLLILWHTCCSVSHCSMTEFTLKPR